MSNDNWRKRLAIAEEHKTVAARRAAVAALKINFSQPGEADEGYYRKPITEKHPTNGINTVVGWIPVSYYMWEGKLTGNIGAGEQNRNMTDAEVGDEELWSWVVSNPIPYEWYSAVADHGDAWPDAVKTFAGLPVTDTDSEVMGLVPAANRDVAKDDNKAPELPPHVEHGTAIDNAIGAGKDLPVTTVPEAALAAGAANLIRDRRLAAEKVANAKILPLKLAYDTERNNWQPKIKQAKDAEDAIRQKVNIFEAAERRRIAAEQMAAMEKQANQDAANARAADRAIANAEPEPPPVVEEVVIPQAPQPVKPTHGTYVPRAKQILKFAVIKDMSSALMHYKTNAQLIELIQKLATADIRAGLEVPGATFREGTE